MKKVFYKGGFMKNISISEKLQEFLKSRNSELEFTKKLVDKDFVIKFGFIVSTVIVMMINLIFEYVTKMSSYIFGGSKPSIFGAINPLNLLRFLPIHLFVLGIFLVIYIKIVLDIKKSFNNIEDGQKGTARFATREEISNEYKSVPIKDEMFEGKGGIPIAWGYEEVNTPITELGMSQLSNIEYTSNKNLKEVMYIDDSPVNNLIIGTTRSGKGETFVFPTIDIYSRASDKPSMIINDPKGELIAKSKEILEKRGYEVLLLNLTDPINSMSYNPLTLIVDAYKREDFGNAQLLCQTLTYSIYFDPNSKDPIWQNTAMSLTNALILAICDECIKKNEEHKVTLFTVADMLTELGVPKQHPEGYKYFPLDEYFNNLPVSSVAKLQYATINFAEGPTKASILVSTMQKLSLFTFEKTAKMTSKNSLNFKDIGFGDSKPKAIFMVTPDYDKSIHVFTSMFVRQVYYVLAKTATLSRSQKCEREVIFLLDEFGNMPAIEGLDNIITVCLGRNIRFNLIIQAYSQLKSLYGDAAQTIEGNCGNQIYILTNDDETSKKFSQLIGEKTIITQSRSGEMYSLNKSHTENLDNRYLLKSDELRKIKEGEMVVVRVIKRSDNNRNKITPNPIFNEGKYAMKYRYQYLSKTFDDSKSFVDIKVESLHEEIDYKKLSLYYKDSKDEVLENQEYIDKKEKELEKFNIIPNKENIDDKLDLKEDLKDILIYKLNSKIGISIKDKEFIRKAVSIKELYNYFNDEDIISEIKYILDGGGYSV